MPNDLHVSERHKPRPGSENRRRPGKARYRYFLGVKWSQVQILSARRSKPALTCVGAGFALLGIFADVWQWASSVPSGREWADFLGKQCGVGGAQVIALGLGVDRQRHRRIVAVPGRDDVHWHAAGQHKADAGITEALEVDAAQAGLLTQALELVGVPLMADGGAVRACRDQTVIGPARAESLWLRLVGGS